MSTDLVMKNRLNLDSLENMRLSLKSVLKGHFLYVRIVNSKYF